jgi:hypothetical protein
MPSETFYCPRCKRQLTKSAQAYVLGEMMSTKDARFIQLGGLSDTVTCPGCGASIDARKMIAGEYDSIDGGASGCLGVIVAAVAFFIIIRDEFPLWATAICAIAIGILVQLGWNKLRAKKQ